MGNERDFTTARMYFFFRHCTKCFSDELKLEETAILNSSKFWFIVKHERALEISKITSL